MAPTRSSFSSLWNVTARALRFGVTTLTTGAGACGTLLWTVTAAGGGAATVTFGAATLTTGAATFTTGASARGTMTVMGGRLICVTSLPFSAFAFFAAGTTATSAGIDARHSLTTVTASTAASAASSPWNA